MPFFLGFWRPKVEDVVGAGVGVLVGVVVGAGGAAGWVTMAPSRFVAGAINA